MKNPKTILRFNIIDNLCIIVNGNDIPLYYFEIQGVVSSTKIEFEQVPMKHVRFEIILQESRIKLRSIAYILTREIRERFHRDDLLEAMAIVNPKF